MFSRKLALNFNKNADINIFLKKEVKDISTQISLLGIRFNITKTKINKLTSVFYASVLLLIMNFVITLG